MVDPLPQKPLKPSAEPGSSGNLYPFLPALIVVEEARASQLGFRPNPRPSRRRSPQRPAYQKPNPKATAISSPTLLSPQAPQAPNLPLRPPLHTAPTTHHPPMSRNPPRHHQTLLLPLPLSPFLFAAPAPRALPNTNIARPPRTALAVRKRVELRPHRRFPMADMAGAEIRLVFPRSRLLLRPVCGFSLRS